MSGLATVSRYASAGALLLLAACGNQPATRPQAYQPQLYYDPDYDPATPPGYFVGPPPDPAPDSANDDGDPAPAPRVVVRRRSAPPPSYAAPAAYRPLPAPAYTPASPALQPAPPPLRVIQDDPPYVPADRSCGWWRLCNFWK